MGLVLLFGHQPTEDVLEVLPLEHRESARKLVEHGGNRGMWKVNKGCRQWYRCDFHKDCPVMLKAVGQPGNVRLKVLAGVAHSLVVFPPASGRDTGRQKRFAGVGGRSELRCNYSTLAWVHKILLWGVAIDGNMILL